MKPNQKLQFLTVTLVFLFLILALPVQGPASQALSKSKESPAVYMHQANASTYIDELPMRV